ncbi:cbb3-type cytochrome oxidase assembly protein CcoS [Venatoribacter cucullus]|uniref:Cbb3-type cytochrome oxidase assembly protein CcoS n=1 Tax=Venatoribacter cucullus TaxID=2661630 RepID=A0A9E8FRI7_9GAMM|nr:cbb3-type cytochrome oxidase assembly protein CcoS [Venatoribacter cucullus]QQD21665.1 cbb3-type cytochrome oxidase assembly protein CcoS [Oceanospirillaceae bacterium ASx5O]QQD24350.1 cbb3-type cytochrome oxidase assembly protein CcoS [Venatoribacter cucullus]UZK03471.1 cbb3-type cytochrome oxidase assembly protein CcoS [Venatoribacter cucullus]
MDLLWAMVPLSFVLLSIAIWVFFWAVRHGQFDDMDSPAHRILFDDDEHAPQKPDAAADTANEPPKSHD